MKKNIKTNYNMWIQKTIKKIKQVLVNLIITILLNIAIYSTNVAEYLNKKD